MEPLRRGGEAGGEETIASRREGELGAAAEFDTDATMADARPMVLRLGDTCAVLAVELRRQRRRLRPLAVEEMLTESESRTRSGER
jgi:hypothetical protein